MRVTDNFSDRAQLQVQHHSTNQTDNFTVFYTRQTQSWKVFVKRRCASMCECIYALIKRLPVGWLYLWGLVSLIVHAQLPWIFNVIREKGLLELEREGGQKENVPGNSQQTHACARTHAQTHYNRACKHSPAAVGGDSNSDKQLWCYKGGRKSIKRDNKIAIEFL